MKMNLANSPWKITKHNFKNVDDDIASVINQIKSLQSQGLYGQASRIIDANKKDVLEQFIIDATTFRTWEEEIYNTQSYAKQVQQCIYFDNNEPDCQYGDIWIGAWKMINTMSIYPDGIDPMTFFQDNNLEKIDVMNTYNELISEEKYKEANNFLSQQEGIYGFFADYFNLIENRIYSLQEYILTKEKINPFIPFECDDADEEPPSILEGDIWI